VIVSVKTTNRKLITALKIGRIIPIVWGTRISILMAGRIKIMMLAVGKTKDLMLAAGEIMIMMPVAGRTRAMIRTVSRAKGTITIDKGPVLDGTMPTMAPNATIVMTGTILGAREIIHATILGKQADAGEVRIAVSVMT